jgi:hypothetical protein
MPALRARSEYISGRRGVPTGNRYTVPSRGMNGHCGWT